MIPKLRFPQYNRATDYCVYDFSDLFEFSSGKNIKQSEASKEFKIPCVRYGELYHMYSEVIDEVINRTDLDPIELRYSFGDEILLPSAGEDPLDIGSASALTLPNIAIGRTINVLRPKRINTYSHIYVSYYINEKLKRKIASLAKGVSISNVYNSDLRTLNAVLPTLSEQNKVASFLRKIDQKINLLTKKKEALETYKKGLMQKIFSQELRFKCEDGTDYPDWEFVKFESILFPRSQRNKNCKYLEVYSVSNKEGFIPQTKQFDGYSVASNDLSNYKLVHPNDIVYNPSRINVGSIAINQTDGIKIVSPLYNIFSVDGGYNPSFWFMLRELHYFKHLVDISCSGSVRDSLSLDDLLSFRMNLPSTEEAKRIDKFLSVYDRKISTVAKQLSALNNLKKGLLQQMFV
jgi:type I restriction enzyme, S subunit